MRRPCVSLAFWALASSWLLTACVSADRAPRPLPNPDGLFVTPELEPGWRAVVDAPSGRTTFLLVDEPGDGRASVEHARAFLAAHPRLFGAASRMESLVTRSVQADPLRHGGLRVRFAVAIDGLELDGGDVTVVLAPDGGVRAVLGAPGAAAALSTWPRIAPSQATLTALAATGLEVATPLAAESAPALIAAPGDAGPRAAFRVIVAGPQLRRALLVDAVTGAVFSVRDLRMAVGVEGSGIGVRGDRRALSVDRIGAGRFVLADPQRRLRTYSGLEAGSPLSSDDPDRWDEAGPAAGAAVDAHANAELVVDYLGLLGRQGVDGNGGATKLVVHAKNGTGQPGGAYWDGSQAVFGDGDSVNVLPYGSALDVVAHELFHGVLASEVSLVYEGQSGALSESIADVFGCLVERTRTGGNWQLGESLSSEPLRDLSDPRRAHLPANMGEYLDLPFDPDNDMGGVHLNSAIPSYAAYLVATGSDSAEGSGAALGLGDTKLRNIWWRATTIYTGPRAGFSDFAGATVAAAEDLYGRDSTEEAAVVRAWQAVGVPLPAGS
jgi:Zn-dependent metalloprotease